MASTEMRQFETPPSLVEAVSDELRRRILAGDYKPGERLIETRITGDLGISRPPLREAFRVLETEGLVVSERRKGTSVISLSAEDVREIYTLRDSLERLAVELGVPVTDHSRLDPLREAVTEMANHSESGSLADMTELNLRFHRGIAALPSHGRLLASYDALAAQLRLCMSINLSMREAMSGDAGESVARHQRLLRLIETGDRADVLAALAEHGHRSFFDSLEP
jgi:DNA-binding GntR family transcriptional regulator